MLLAIIASQSNEQTKYSVLNKLKWNKSVNRPQEEREPRNRNRKDDQRGWDHNNVTLVFAVVA